MVFPAQTPDYQRQSDKKFMRRLATCIALFVGGTIVIAVGGEARTALPRVVWLGIVVLGVVFLLVSLLLPVRWAFNFKAASRKEQALRKVGTVELLTVASKYVRGGETVDTWELTSELEIRLDDGPTFRGSYRTSVEDWRLRESGSLDTWFYVGSSMRCLYNPANPDKVIVFPRAKRGDAVTFNDIANTGPDHVSFYSAT